MRAPLRNVLDRLRRKDPASPSNPVANPFKLFTQPKDNAWPAQASLPVPGLEPRAPGRRQMKGTREVGLMMNGVEVGRCVVQVGVLGDSAWPVVDPTPVVEFEEYVNVQINRVKGGSYLKRYWGVMRGGVLEFYDFEYKDSKPMISTLPVKSHMSSFKSADPETMCVPNCLEIRMPGALLADDAAAANAPAESFAGEDGDAGAAGVEEDLQEKWRRSVVDEDGVVYISAEGKDGFEGWRKALEVYV
ncbi:hypothetical protein HK101_002098 [Irineochytrium annulatum]|nr:hypothetical protein HK101_002098 [Irineochytrium annulatum]